MRWSYIDFTLEKLDTYILKWDRYYFKEEAQNVFTLTFEPNWTTSLKEAQHLFYNEMKELSKKYNLKAISVKDALESN